MVSRISNKDKILANGLKVVLERGYVGASVRDIVEAAGVPQGSFTNHFASKEAFSLEILDLYFANNRGVMGNTLRNEGLSPLKRLRAYIAELREAVADCLKAAVKDGELPKSLKTSEVASFIVAGLQGAWLVSKVERDLAIAENFKKTLFSTVLAKSDRSLN